MPWLGEAPRGQITPRPILRHRLLLTIHATVVSWLEPLVAVDAATLVVSHRGGIVGTTSA
jgi:hypothetical protein